MSGSDLLVRPARPDDAAEAARLWLALQEEQGALQEAFVPSEDAPRRWANDFEAWVRADDVRCLRVAVREGRIVGLASAAPWYPAPIYRASEEVFMTDLYVDPEARRQGVGRALVEDVLRWARERGATRVRLRVASGNAGADAFWAALGAEPLSRTLGISV